MNDAVNKILFISLSNIGDAILTTPVLVALHERYPQATIDIVGDQRSSEVFKHCPFRGEIIHKQKELLLRGIPALLKQLWSQSYDLIIDLRTDGLAYLIPAGKRLTKLNRKISATHSVEQHMAVIVDIYAEEPPACKVWFDAADKVYAQQALGKYCDKKLLGLAPGANADIKIWPKENYVSLIRKTAADFDAVVFLGDDRDEARAQLISSQIETPSINLCGNTSLLQAAAVECCLSVLVGNDSGLGHLASAVGTPTITIFGVGEPERYRPWGKKSSWLVGEQQNIKAVSADEVVGLMRKQGLLK